MNAAEGGIEEQARMKMKGCWDDGVGLLGMMVRGCRGRR